MVSARNIISKLPPYTGREKTLSREQYVNEIVYYLLQKDKECRAEYDLIYSKFGTGSVYRVCENVFDFLKENTGYKVESEENQRLKTPAAIIEEYGNDCKNYSLFIAGVLGAYSRNVKPVDYAFRFASYIYGEDEPQHVFVVVNPDTDNEIWIDPVLSTFNSRSTVPYSYTDYKPNNMALYSVSGIPKQVGKISALPKQQPRKRRLGIAVETIVAVASVLKNIFSSGGPNPNDWKGWPASGADARYWTIHDGDSVSNEAVNVLSWINANGIAKMYVSDSGVPAVTIEQIVNKLTRGGYGSQAQALLANPATNTGSGVTAGKDMTMTYVLIGGAAIAAYFMLRKKK